MVALDVPRQNAPRTLFREASSRARIRVTIRASNKASAARGLLVANRAKKARALPGQAETAHRRTQADSSSLKIKGSHKRRGVRRLLKARRGLASKALHKVARRKVRKGRRQGQKVAGRRHRARVYRVHRKARRFRKSAHQGQPRGLLVARGPRGRATVRTHGRRSQRQLRSRPNPGKNPKRFTSSTECTN